MCKLCGERKVRFGSPTARDIERSMPDWSPALHITTAAHADRPVVERLLQLYLHDFSGFASADDPYGKVDGHGRFAYAHLDRYWQDAACEPLLFRVGADLAGFALINDWSPSGLGTDKTIAEFFVLRKYRRCGVGTRAAIEMVHQRSVTWEIAVTGYNGPALLFWRSVVASLRGFELAEFAGDGERWSGTIWRLTASSSVSPGR